MHSKIINLYSISIVNLKEKNLFDIEIKENCYHQQQNINSGNRE
jgi:hypothetical protein